MDFSKYNFDLNLYKVFITVAQTKNISKAAELLYISQPAISYNIKMLENTLGGKLFFRTPKGVELTPEAEKLYNTVSESFNMLSLGERIFKEDGNLENGELFIRMQSKYISSWLISIYKDISRKISEHKITYYQ